MCEKIIEYLREKRKDYLLDLACKSPYDHYFNNVLDIKISLISEILEEIKEF